MNKPLPPLWFRLAFFLMVAALAAACVSLPLAAVFWLLGKALDLYCQTSLTAPFFTLWGSGFLLFLLGLTPYCLRRAFEGDKRP